MSETMHPVRPGQGGGGTTADDHRTALRFIIGRPGWQVEARARGRGETHLVLTTPCRDAGGQRCWKVARTHEGLLVCDGATGRRLWTVPTMREALVEVWEAATDAAPD